MDKGVYLVSVKSCQDKWLPTRQVYAHNKLLKVIQNRLLPSFVIYSAPICECVQYAGLMATHNIITINLIEALNRKYSQDFESGLPSSLQTCTLASLEIPGFVSPDHFYQIFQYVYAQDSNSILFIQQDLTQWFSAFTEIRLDNEDITVYRVHYSLSTSLIIRSCVYRKKHWKIKLKTVEGSRPGSCSLKIADTGEVLCQVPKFRSHLDLVLYPKSYRKTLRPSTETMVYVKSLAELNLTDKKLQCQEEGEVISNVFYVPEYFVEACHSRDFWLCRISHQGENHHDLITLVSGKYTQIIDCTEIPANDTILVKVRQRKIAAGPSFCIKLEEKIISNLFTYAQDQIELIYN